MSRLRADLLLVERGLFESRAKARAAIEAGGVTADGVPVSRASQMLDAEAVVEARAAHRWVGRGALKLEAALQLWPVRPEGRVVLDVGASTGGFTEVCLDRGASCVYAVDVGRGQLHPRLAADPRVVDLSGTDARELTAAVLAPPPSLVVCDASFIGLAKVLPVPLSLAAPGAELVALVKPQFELGPDQVGKGGLVRDAAAHEAALRAVITELDRLGWAAKASAESPVRGGEGAIEYLLWAARD
ncbi:MAG: TlyA family RNA methyltransferase [Caulobacteraceae bacterium]|nr:TlyA family RNA methyltransferase [Caulobacteraceae bacterium]